MTLDEDRERLLAVWTERFLSDEDIVCWAERHLMAHDDVNAIPTWLLNPAQYGPAAYEDRADVNWPSPLEYSDRFALRAAVLDIPDDVDVVVFAKWAVVSCSAEDPTSPRCLLVSWWTTSSPSPQAERAPLNSSASPTDAAFPSRERHVFMPTS